MGCQCCETGNGDGSERSPIVSVSQESLGHVGEEGRIVLVAESGTEPLEWINTEHPMSWSVETSSDGRQWQASGPLFVGASQPGIQVAATAEDSQGSQSERFEKQLHADSYTYEATVTFVDEPFDGLKQYSIDLGSIPRWPEDSGGSIRLWIDTEGLAPRNPQDDRIKLFNNDTPPNPEVTSNIGGVGLTRAGISDEGETIVIRGEQWRQACQDRKIGLSLRCFHDNDFDVVKVQVTLR